MFWLVLNLRQVMICDLASGVGKARKNVNGSLVFSFIYIINGLTTGTLVPQWVPESTVVQCIWGERKMFKVVPISEGEMHH